MSTARNEAITKVDDPRPWSAGAADPVLGPERVPRACTGRGRRYV
jgi:hypothetical protein